MKRILCLLLALVTVAAAFTFVSYAGDGTESVLTDQESVIGSYKDAAKSYTRPDGGMCSTMEIYPSPEAVSTRSPSGHTFLMINLANYSGQHRADGKDMPLDDNFFTSVRTTFETARKSGATLGIRFRFDERGNEKREPDWDNMVQMFLDIEESGILEEYKDIIVWCEMGTLGAFGEMWGTRYGDYGYSDELIDLYLTILPDEVPFTDNPEG